MKYTLWKTNMYVIFKGVYVYMRSYLLWNICSPCHLILHKDMKLLSLKVVEILQEVKEKREARREGGPV